jgi:hypothetical protein
MTASQPSLFHVPPVAGASAIAREAETPQATRRKGLTEAQLHRDNLWSEMLDLYGVGAKTDAEMAKMLGVERTTVTARRDELIKAGKVKATGVTRLNQKSGVPNMTWGLV